MLKIREFHFNSNYRQFLNSSMMHKSLSWIVEFFENQVLSRCYDKSYLLTRADREAHFKNVKRFDYMYNPSSFTPESVPAYDNRDKIILAVGRLTEQKNFEALIGIWSEIYQKVPGWRLRILGNGNLRHNLDNLISALGVEATVEMPGASSEIETEMGKASIYAMTSKYEGFPLVLLEAQTMGLPIVAYNTPYGPSEIIRNDVDGYIVGYNDNEEFKKRLLQMITDCESRRRMSANAIERSREFTPDRIARKWMQNYSHLLERSI